MQNAGVNPSTYIQIDASSSTLRYPLQIFLFYLFCYFSWYSSLFFVVPRFLFQDFLSSQCIILSNSVRVTLFSGSICFGDISEGKLCYNLLIFRNIFFFGIKWPLSLICLEKKHQSIREYFKRSSHQNQ